MGQAKGPAKVFRPALDQIRSQTRLPILLPSKLPSAVPESAVKLAWGEVRDDGYVISLYFSEEGSKATYAAGFSGSTHALRMPDRDEPDLRRIPLSGGRIGVFTPVSCGGSCSPANLWFEQNGVTYGIQVRLQSRSAERSQEKILVAVANSMVTAQ